MGTSGIPRWQVVLVVALAAGISFGSLAYLASAPGSPGTTAYGGVNYATEVVQIPVNGTQFPANETGWGPLTHITFGGIQFRLWPELESPGVVSYLQGTGGEPSGIDLAFVVFSINESARTWFAPDGEFGVTWLSGVSQSITVKLWVAEPPLIYAHENVTLNPINGSNDTPSTIDYSGVTFHLQVVGWFSPAGPSLAASATEPNGTVAPLTLWAGPLFACGIQGNTPSWILGNATCLERAATDHSVALVWDGDLTVTLMIRVQ